MISGAFGAVTASEVLVKILEIPLLDTRAVKLEAQEDWSQKGDDCLGLHRARTRSARMMMLRKGYYCPRSVPPA